MYCRWRNGSRRGSVGTRARQQLQCPPVATYTSRVCGVYAGGGWGVAFKLAWCADWRRRRPDPTRRMYSQPQAQSAHLHHGRHAARPDLVKHRLQLGVLAEREAVRVATDEVRAAAGLGSCPEQQT